MLTNPQGYLLQLHTFETNEKVLAELKYIMF